MTGADSIRRSRLRADETHVTQRDGPRKRRSNCEPSPLRAGISFPSTGSRAFSSMPAAERSSGSGVRVSIFRGSSSCCLRTRTSTIKKFTHSQLPKRRFSGATAASASHENFTTPSRRKIVIAREDGCSAILVDTAMRWASEAALWERLESRSLDGPALCSGAHLYQRLRIRPREVHASRKRSGGDRYHAATCRAVRVFRLVLHL